MPQPRLLNKRPGGIEVWFHPQPDGTFVIETRQDVGDIIEFNKAVSVENGKSTRGRDMFPVAKIPVVVQYEWLKRYGVNIYDPEHEPQVRKLLDDPEWRYLRTSEIIL